MDISALLAMQLSALTEALGVDDLDLEAHLQALLYDVTTAISSCLGLSVVIAVDGQVMTLTAVEPDQRIGTSLRIPLEPVSFGDEGSHVIFYAATPGALVDLAADLAYAIGSDQCTLTLDGDLEPNFPPADGFDRLSTMNRAVGLLIDRGYTAAGAQAELRRRGKIAGDDVFTAARIVLDEAEVRDA